MELNDSALNELEVLVGDFAVTDRLMIGVSAVVFDGESTVEEYLLRLGHEGPCWLDFDTPGAIVCYVDGQSLPLFDPTASQPYIDSNCMLHETVEFTLTDADLTRLISAREVVFELRSPRSIVRKHLTDEEQRALASFRREAKLRARFMRPPGQPTPEVRFLPGAADPQIRSIAS